MTSNKGSQTLLGFAIGLGIGAALAILFAPKSGEDTRKFLMDSATDALDDARATGRKLTRRAQRVVADVADRVSDVADDAERAYRKAQGA